MVRRARAALPADDGRVTMVGTVVATHDRLVAPHSKRACVAYWERSLIETEGTWSTTGESTASVDFLLRCGEGEVVVEGSLAEVLHEPASATRTISDDGHAATEEVAAQPGDQLVVAGRLVRGPAAGPFRTAARIEGAGRTGVVLGIIAAP